MYIQYEYEHVYKHICQCDRVAVDTNENKDEYNHNCKSMNKDACMATSTYRYVQFGDS